MALALLFWPVRERGAIMQQGMVVDKLHVARLQAHGKVEFRAVGQLVELNFSMRLAPGDMQFVYNHALLHDRTAFTDWPEQQRKRHLLRLWLAVPGDRPLPDCFASRYGSVEIGNRGGGVANPQLRR